MVLWFIIFLWESGCTGEPVFCFAHTENHFDNVLQAGDGQQEADRFTLTIDFCESEAFRNADDKAEQQQAVTDNRGYT